MASDVMVKISGWYYVEGFVRIIVKNIENI